MKKKGRDMRFRVDLTAWLRGGCGFVAPQYFDKA
jgi:hypothetical protein